METIQLSELAEPVMERAVLATSSTPSLRDRAASLVLERLDYPCPLARSVAQAYSQRARSSDWIDERVMEFVSQFPTALCIEINGGLSTRFHRISDHMDWPQFSWLAVNTPDVDAWLRQVFPRTDNFRNIAGAAPLASWHEPLDLGQAPRVLVIVGEQRALMDARDLRILCVNLQRVIGKGLRQVDVVLRHCIDGFEGEVKQLLPGATIEATFTPGDADQSFLARFNPFRDKPRQLVHGQLIHLRAVHQELSNP